MLYILVYRRRRPKSADASDDDDDYIRLLYTCTIYIKVLYSTPYTFVISVYFFSPLFFPPLFFFLFSLLCRTRLVKRLAETTAFHVVNEVADKNGQRRRERERDRERRRDREREIERERDNDTEEQ